MNTKINKTTKLLGKNIRAIRAKRGFTQEELASASNLSATMIGHIERGEKSPTVETVASISKALNIAIYKLFMFED